MAATDTLPPALRYAAEVATVQSGEDLVDATFTQLVAEATTRASCYRSWCDQREDEERAAARELSLAITALEDAQMRFTRAYAHMTGRFNPADLERADLDGHDQGD